MRRDISLVIVTWNKPETARQVLQNLVGVLPSHASVVVVDNGSGPDVRRAIDAFEGRLTLRTIFNETNVGFGKAVNQGIASSDADVILLNDDVVVTAPHWIERMETAAYADERTGIVGCRIVNGKGGFSHAGLQVPKDSYWGVETGGGELDLGQFQASRTVDAVTFALAYIKRETIERIGGLDEQYFAYFEDVDFCFRARRAGYQILYFGDLTCAHHQGASTESNQALRNAIYRQSQEQFIGQWSGSEFYSSDRGIVWHSIANLSTGYGISSQYFIRHLDGAGIDVRYKYIYGRGTVFDRFEPFAPDSQLRVIQSRPLKAYPVQVAYAQGDLFHRNFGRYRVGYTMLEADGLPDEWVRQSNAMDEVWVPSQFNAETFRRAGVTVPIHVMPLGIDADHFNPRITPVRLSPKFTFLSVFEWSERKGQELLIRAYLDEFGDSSDTVLVMKVFQRDVAVDIAVDLRKIGVPIDQRRVRLTSVHGNPDVTDLPAVPNDCAIFILHNADVPYYQMGALHRGADCFVLPTRGEGWGMPILEAMACGVPAIATAWSSQNDFFDERFGYPLRIRGLVPAVTRSPYYRTLRWANPDGEHLRFLMRHVYEHREEARAKAEAASRFALAEYAWPVVTSKLQRRIEEISG